MPEEVQLKLDYKSFSPRDLPKINSFDADIQWIIQDFIQKGTVTIISGESGHGKSSVCLYLAESVSLGKPFLEMKTNKTPVLIVDRENGITIYHQRFERLGISDNQDFMIWGPWMDLYPPGPTNVAIKRFVTEEQPLIIFDSLVGFHPGSEQDASETRKYMDEFRQLANNGATVIVIHHTGKGEKTKKYRGSSDIQASIDAGWLLTQKKTLLKCLEFSSWKFREGEVKPITFGFTDEGFELIDPNFINEDNPHWKRIAEVIKTNPGLKQVEISKLVPEISPATVNRALLWMDNKHKVIVQCGPGKGHHYRWAPEEPDPE